MPRREQPHPSAEKIGRRIRELRKERGLTMEKLAWGCEMDSKGHLSNIEKGLAIPTIETLEKLADGLEASVVDLVNDPDISKRARLIELTRTMTNKDIETLMRTAVRLCAKP